jgi:charged multivesicular body protein 5
MNRIFGTSKPAPPKATSIDMLNKLESRGESVENKLKKLDAELIKLKQQMNKMREGPPKEMVKKRALRILQQKKMYTNQYEGIQIQANNMEQQNFMLYSAKSTQEQVAFMKDNVKELKKEFKKIDMTQVENIQDQLQDVYDDHQEIQEMMSINLGDQFEMDDDELDAELESLGEMDMSDTSCLDLDYNTPSVPSKEPTKRPMTYGSVEVDEFGLPNMILN